MEEFPAFDNELAGLGNMGEQPSIIEDEYENKSSEGSQDNNRDNNSSLIETGLLNNLANQMQMKSSPDKLPRDSQD